MRKTLDPKFLVRVKVAARCEAKKYKIPDYADDLFQEVALRVLEGHGKGQTVHQSIIDARRRLFGDRRFKPAQAKHREMIQYGSFKDAMGGSSEPSYEGLDVYSILNELEPEHADALYRYYLKDQSMEEIGRAHGVTMQSIFVLIDRAMTQAKKMALNPRRRGPSEN